MLAVLIGSYTYSCDYNDIDLICDQEFADSFKPETSLPVDLIIPEEGTAHYDVLHTNFETINLFGYTVKMADLPTLADLKKAHLIHPHKWERHIEGYALIKMLLGVETWEGGPVFRKHRKEIKAKAHPKLNVSKADFFGEGERYNILDHDGIHRAIALDGPPAYTLMQDGEVWCSKKKWSLLTEQQKRNCLLEEASVLALERAVIPSLFLKDHPYMGRDWAFRMALQKICTTITSGWFRDYAIENYHAALAHQPDYVEAFLDNYQMSIC